MERSPRVSLGLPVYNGAQFLQRELDSLLAQDFEDFEIIICDNGSEDSTAQICASHCAARMGEFDIIATSATWA